LGERDFPGRTDHAAEARRQPEADKPHKRNVHKLATGEPRRRTFIQVRPGCVRVVDRKRQNACIQAITLDRFTYDANL
jgi:hypothetical protein